MININDLKLDKLKLKIQDVIENNDFSCGCCGTTDCDKSANEVLVEVVNHLKETIFKGEENNETS